MHLTGNLSTIFPSKVIKNFYTYKDISKILFVYSEDAISYRHSKFYFCICKTVKVVNNSSKQYPKIMSS